MKVRHSVNEPPRWAQRFIEWYCKPELAEDLVGDLNEIFERNVETIGVRRARLVYIIDAIKFLRTYTVRTPKLNALNNWIMIGSYIKTSGRNVMRNKLFSAINIIGLAISMSVGLLMVGYLHDLLSFDRFHEKGDRIYRVVSHPVWADQDWGRFASTSLKAGRLIKEKVAGIEEVTIVRRGFEGDAIVGENVIPMEGLYAEPSFFNVFSFPLIKGNKTTALKEPYSIVLTETAVKKYFGNKEALGQAIKFDTVEYQVTGIMKDVPFFSHIQFEALVSLSSLDKIKDYDMIMAWSDMWSNYTYMVLAPETDPETLRSNIIAIADSENAALDHARIDLDIQHFYSIAFGEDLSNSIGAITSVSWVSMVGALAAVVILSACFNYTNLSIARSLRRFKEIGLRKVIGAGRNQVRQQFLFEAIIISLAALGISFGMFLLLRPTFVEMMDNRVQLLLTPLMIAGFIGFSIFVGVMAGFLPAVFFARVNIIQALRDVQSVKVFRHLTMRRTLVVVQYSFTLIFITTTVVGYKQYEHFLASDLGYDTENIVNVRLENNKADVVLKEMAEIPEVIGTSKARLITSLGNFWTAYVKYNNMSDSIRACYNTVDENYLPLHKHTLIAGTNFIARPTKTAERTEVIVNEMALKKLNIGEPGKPETALGAQLLVDRAPLRIVGVMKDFHYGKADTKIEPVVFMYWVPANGGFVNLKVQSKDLPATMAKIQDAWKEVDNVHPVEAKFYDQAIEESYDKYSGMIKLVGFLSFLAISIASMGLFGMVVFTTETRLKEISIRKVLGATSGNLVYLLSRGFLLLLGISGAIAIPVTWYFFEGYLLVEFPEHTPVGIPELFAGLLGVVLIAFAMIGAQTMKAAHTNPAEVLKSE